MIVLKILTKIMIDYYFKIQEFKVFKLKKIDKIKGTYIIWINLFRSMTT